MSICINIVPNLHLSLELLEEVNKNWSLEVNTAELSNKTAKKKAIIEKITTVLKFEPYIKIFFVRNGRNIIPIPGSKPTAKSTSNLIGITTFINKAKQNPNSIPQYLSFECKEENIETQSENIAEQTLTIKETPINQGVQLNQFEVKTKSELPKFDPNKTTTEGWIGSSVFALELGGVTEPKKMVSHLMLALDPKLQPSVQSLMKKEIESTTPHKTITVDIFKKSLKAVAGKSTNDLDTIVENLTFNRGHYKSMREFYIDLEQYIKDLNPDIENDNALAKIVSRAFKKKVPVEIRTAPAFQMSDETGVKLADLAQTLYSNLKSTSSCVNNFVAAKPFGKKTVTFRDQNPRYQRQEKYRSNSLPNLNALQNRPKVMRCFYCSKLGHRKSDCRKLKSDLRSRGKSRRQLRK